jgi:hypothetical protein
MKNRLTSEEKLAVGARYNALIELGQSGVEAAETIRQQFSITHPDGIIKQLGEQHKLRAGQDLDERIRAVAQQVFQEMFQDILNKGNMIEEFQEMPPEPTTLKGRGKGRRENRIYCKISVTVDAALWKLFMEEQRRSKISSARLLDSILWRHYGKPQLSFELPEEKQQQLRKEFGKESD